MIRLAALALLLASAAQAHGAGTDPVPAWTFDPWVVAPLLLSAALYARGVGVLWRRAGPGRGIRPLQLACYVAGWLVLVGALVSPLHWLGEHLFAAHMVEHELVMAVAAPLLVLARPVGAWLWALPRPLRDAAARLARRRGLRRAWGAMTVPLPATLWHGVAIWAWHVPAWFDAALRNAALHRLQHLTFLVSAVLFWWALVRARAPGQAAALVVLTMLHTGLLGALLTFAPRVLYVWQTLDAGRWGLTPLEDQQLAGLVMWVPAGTVYAGAALGFAALWVWRSGSSHEVRP